MCKQATSQTDKKKHHSGCRRDKLSHTRPTVQLQGLHNSPECQGRKGHAHGHTRSSYEQQSALTSQFSHCQDWKYQPPTLRLSSPNTPQPHPGFQEEQRQINQASDQRNRLQCVQRRSAEVHELGRRRATNSLSNVTPVQC